jgi:heterodisulfide reductase subunit A
MPERPQIVVVGGGIAGLTAALNLARRGQDVALVEREAVLGGNALTVCCKAVQGDCQFCGGCLLADQIAAAKAEPRIRLFLRTTVARVKRDDGGFLISLAGPQAPAEPLHAAAVILATGFDHVDAHTKGPYGYGILPAVTTGEEMERRLKEEGQHAYDGLNLRQVAFIQCVGSRDEHVGRGYCSQVCCRYALRLARLLKARRPEVEITIFKMDIQYSGRDMAAAWRAAAQEGIRLVAGLPAVIRRSEADPRRVSFLYDDILAGQFTQQDFDLVVLSTGMQPRRDAAAVADLWGLNLDPYGFFASAGEETTTLVPGVFVAGSCQAPRSIAESAAHAHQAAEACIRYLQEREA